MKIAVRGGHNFQATGASALIDEVTEDRKIKDAVIVNLKALGHEVLDVTPGDCDVYTDLAYGVDHAENWGAELFVSCHFDKCFDSYEGVLGHACWIYGEGGNAETISDRIIKSVVSETGFKDRGVRVNPKLYELRKTSCPAIIVEVCFCEATEDIAIYKEKGPELIGKLIAEGISDKKVVVAPEQETKLVPEQVKRYAENGTATITTDSGITYRTLPSVHTGTIMGTFDCGFSLTYDEVIFTPKYVWIGWTNGAGHRRYMPVRNRETNTAWCSFK